MMNNTSALQKVQRRTKQIRKAHPGISFRDAQKQAGTEIREGVSGRKKPGGIKYKGASVSVGAKYRVRHVVEKIGSAEVNQTRDALKRQLELQRAWMLLAKDSATSVAKKKKLAKDIAENKKEARAIGGVRRSPKKRRATKKRRR
jgi:hypothetical protein